MICIKKNNFTNVLIFLNFAITKFKMMNIISIKSKSTENTNRYFYIRNTIILPGLIIFSQFYFFQPLIPLLSKTMNLSPTVSSFAMSFTMLGVATGLFISIFYIDRFIRKKVITASLISSSLVTILSALSWRFEILIMLSFFKGLLASGVLAVTLVYISEEVVNSNKRNITGLYLAGNVLGGMAGRIIALMISDLYNWRIATVIVGLIGLVLVIPFITYFPNSSNFKSKKTSVILKSKQLKTLLNDLPFLKLIIIIILNMGVFVSTYNYLGFRLKATPFLLPERSISLYYMIYIIGAFGSVITSKLSNKIPLRTLLKALIIFFTIGLFCLLTTNIYFFSLGLMILTYCMFGIQFIIVTLISNHNKKQKSIANCTYLILTYIGSSIIGSFSGSILSYYKWGNFVGTLIIGIIISFVFVTFINKK